MWRIALGVVIGTAVLLGLAAWLVPIQPETCEELNERFMHRARSVMHTDETVGLCLARLWPEPALPREPPPPPPGQAAPPRPIIAAPSAPSAPPTNQLPPELALLRRELLDRAGPVVCPLLRGRRSLSIYKQQDGEELFVLADYCPECRYIRAPLVTVRTLDGQVWCDEARDHVDCMARVNARPLIFTFHTEGDEDTTRRQAFCIREK